MIKNQALLENFQDFYFHFYRLYLTKTVPSILIAKKIAGCTSHISLEIRSWTSRNNHGLIKSYRPSKIRQKRAVPSSGELTRPMTPYLGPKMDLTCGSNNGQANNSNPFDYLSS